VLGNHDRPRVASRLGPGQERVGQMLLLTLRGTPTCYYGDELGMTNVVIPPERLQDRGAINQPERPDANRDPERTPMQWDGSANAGFSPPGVEPWLPLSNDYAVQNVAAETADPRSVLSFFRRLTALRGTTPALSVGSYRSIETGNPDVLGYARVHAQARLLVLLNFSQAAQSLELGAVAASGRTLLSTEMDREGTESLEPLLLRPNEGIIVEW
jgi:alpha-glucosidase